MGFLENQIIIDAMHVRVKQILLMAPNIYPPPLPNV